jgi:hypothetical protein
MREADLPRALGAPVRTQRIGKEGRVSIEFHVGGFVVDVTMALGRIVYLVIHPPLPPENIPDRY